MQPVRMVAKHEEQTHVALFNSPIKYSKTSARYMPSRTFCGSPGNMTSRQIKAAFKQGLIPHSLNVR